MTATTTVTCNSSTYTQVTTNSSGYALIYNPIHAKARALIYVGPTIPAPATDAKMELLADEAFERGSNITDHIWVKMNAGNDLDIVVTE